MANQNINPPTAIVIIFLGGMAVGVAIAIIFKLELSW